MAKKRKSARKVRVQFEKNRHKRARVQDLTRQTRENEEHVEDLEQGERISGKGVISRFRTVLAEDDSENVQRSIDESQTEKGRVLKCIGANNVLVQIQNSDCTSTLNCTVRRVVRTMARDSRNPVVAGDHVLLTRVDDGSGVIERVDSRRRVLTRVSRGEAHVIVANVDQAVIVASIDAPPLKPGLIDRFLSSAEKGEIRPIICLNKMDLGDPVRLQRVVGLYARLGYDVVLTNAITGEGVSELARLLINKETVFTGQSGVGKTSLLNAVQPDLTRLTFAVSDATSKGRHTTRVSELIPLSFGGWVVDTPGIRQLQLWDVEKEEVEGLFIEFRPFVARCRFPNCSHTHESSCGVKQAVESGLISPSRYKSYLRMVLDENRHRRLPAFKVDLFDDE